MKAAGLRAVLASFVAVALVAGAVGIASLASADEGPLSEALSAYAAGNSEDGLAKLRAYVEGNPGPEEILGALRGADDRLIGRILVMGGEHEKLLKYLIVKARPMVESREVDPAEVEAQVEQAVKGPNLDARRQAAMKLRQAGELAVPALYAFLGSEEPETVVSAMLAFRVLGGDATMALSQVLQSEDARLRGYAAEVLGDLGDRSARPALQQLLEKDADDTVKEKATAALAKLGGPGASAAAAWIGLGNRYYAHDPTIVSGLDATRNLWRWEDGALARYTVPAYVYPFQVAEACAARALDLQPDHDDARALLVRAVLAQKVEADVLKAGGLEPPAALEGSFDLAASQGFKAAGDALRACLASSDWDVAIECCAVVAKTFGGESLQGHPLGDALVAKEKRVRYAAAIAALHMSPARSLPNADKVGALAAQAASESAVRQVLVIDSNEQTRSRLVMDLAHAGFVVGGEASGTAGVNRAKTAPTVDVIIVRGDLGDATTRTELDQYGSSILVIDELLLDARTKDMRIVVLVPEGAEAVMQAHRDFYTNKYGDRLKGLIASPIDTASLTEVVQAAAQAGDLSPDEARANRLALTAAQAFAKTDFSCSAFDLAVAVEPLSTAALEGPSPEVRLAAVEGLGNIRQGGAEALLKVLANGEGDDLKAAAATALGNVLSVVKAGPGQIEALLEASKVEGAVGQAALRALGKVRGISPELRQQIFREHQLPVGTKAGSSS